MTTFQCCCVRGQVMFINVKVFKNICPACYIDMFPKRQCCRPVSMTRNENVRVNVTLRQKTNKPRTPTICLLSAKGK